MKQGLLIAVILLTVIAASVMPAHFVFEHETITQLLWNRNEALIFAGLRRDGRTGSYPAVPKEFIRGVFGANPKYTETREWVVVGRITPTGVERHIEEATGFFHPQPSHGAVFRFRGNDPLLKWNGQGFTQASPEERTQFQSRTFSSTPNYSNIEGWSSRMNLLNQEELRVQIPLEIGDRQAILIAERSADRSRKTITIQFDGQKPVEVLSVSEGLRFVTGTKFLSLMKAQ
jgi:hypothetical protein